MKDKEVFLRFMELMNMKPKKINDNIILFKDRKSNTDTFTKVGYDDFKAGAIFDDNGNIMAAYLDSHVAQHSENYYQIKQAIKETI